MRTNFRKFDVVIIVYRKLFDIIRNQSFDNTFFIDVISKRNFIVTSKRRIRIQIETNASRIFNRFFFTNIFDDKFINQFRVRTSIVFIFFFFIDEIDSNTRSNTIFIDDHFTRVTFDISIEKIIYN